MANENKVKQHIPKALRYSMRDFQNEFPNDSACLEYIKEQRWPEGIAPCAKCKCDRKHYRVGNRTAYACDHCGNHIYPLAGTIFEKTSTSLRLWFYAMYLMGSTRCGISAKQVQRETGVTYKTAWRMFKQIRSLLSDDDLQLEGPTVEVDESYFGGVRKWQRGRPMRGDKKKTPIVAIVHRGGKVVARAVPDTTGKRLRKLIRKHVTPGSVIYTDEYYGYFRVPQMQDALGRRMHYKALHGQAQRRYLRPRRPHSYKQRRRILEPSKERHRRRVSCRLAGILADLLGRIHFPLHRRHKGNQQFKAILERTAVPAA